MGRVVLEFVNSGMLDWGANGGQKLYLSFDLNY